MRSIGEYLCVGLVLIHTASGCASEVVDAVGSAGTTGGVDERTVPAAPTITKTTKVTRTGAAADERFGESVAISGDTALVGSRLVASAVALRRGPTGWTQEAELEPHWISGVDSVAVDDNVAVIGATYPSSQGSAGAAYVFRHGAEGWKYEAVLTGMGTVPEDLFGGSVSVDGDTIAVGAPGDYPGWPGVVYVFERRNGLWSETAKISASDAAVNDQFGYTVTLSGETLAVAAPRMGVHADATHVAYVYTRSGDQWVEAKTTALDLAAESGPMSASVFDDRVIAGDRMAGAAHVLVRDGDAWKRETALAGFGIDFGYAVGISAAFAIVGRPRGSRDESSTDGAAVVFAQKAGLWSAPTDLVPPDPAPIGGDGGPLAVSDLCAIVGAPSDGDEGEQAGAVYFFDLAPP